jgi:hypothetical protein
MSKSTRAGFNPKRCRIKTDGRVAIDQAFIAHYQIPAEKATAADTDGIHAAVACTTPAISAEATVKAASHDDDTLTITAPASLGATANALKVSLVNNDSDALSVTKDDDTKTIIIALANSTAANNAAANVQTAIRALDEVGGIDVTGFTCAADGNWDTAAIATGEQAPVQFSGGQTAAPDIITTGITQPSVPRSITATAAAASGGSTGDIGAIAVTVEGYNATGEFITETLPAFTANTAATKEGSKAFAKVTKIIIPAHDGTGATTAIGWGEKLGLPYKLSHNTVLAAYLDNAIEESAPEVTTSATALESNTIDLASSLESKVVDVYLIV